MTSGRIMYLVHYKYVSTKRNKCLRFFWIRKKECKNLRVIEIFRPDFNNIRIALIIDRNQKMIQYIQSRLYTCISDDSSHWRVYVFIIFNEMSYVKATYGSSCNNESFKKILSL